MIISRYFAKEVLQTTTIVTLILMLIFLSNQFVRFLNEIAAGKLAIGMLLHLLALEAPFLLGYLLPIGFFFGILLAYGRIYADSEMTVLRACGMGPGDLVRITFKFSLVVFIIVALFVLWLGPKAALALQRAHRYENGQLLLQTILPGRFIPSSDGQQVLYIETISRDHTHLNHIFTAQMQKPSDKNQKPNWVITTANEASQMIDPDTGQFFIIGHDGYRYTGEPGKKNYDVLKFGEYGLQIHDKQKNVALDEKTVSLSKIWRHKKDNLVYEAEWQWRWSMPFSIFLLVLLGVPLSHVKPRHGKFAHIFPATLLYIVYANMLFVGRSWIESGVLAPFPGLLIIHLPMLLIAVMLLANDYGWRSLKFKLFSQAKPV